MICNHNSLSHKEIKNKIKDIVYCQQESCDFHVEKMLPSVLIMGMNYIFSGIILTFICFMPLIYFDNFYFRLLAIIPLGAFGIWGIIVACSGIYISLLCLFDQYIITHNTGKRYRHIEFKLFK